MAGCSVSPDCHQAAETGSALAALGLPAEADRHAVHPSCRGMFQEAWAESAAEYCRPELGFGIGHSDAVYYGICTDAEFNRNYRLGRTLRVLEVERENLEAILAASEDPARQARIRARLRVLERDIPELETLARLQGLLAPAPEPD